MSASRHFTIPAVIALVCLSACGCVRRRMTIVSNPPGALVYVDDYEIGTTPISTNFIYYGQRKIQLVKDGYETKTVLQTIPPPWYQYFPLDFVSENFVPGEIRDRRTLTYTLTPQAVAPTDTLLGRAEELRRGVHSVTGTTPTAASIQPRPGPISPALPMAPSTPFEPAVPQTAPTYPPQSGSQPLYPLPPSQF